MDWKMMFTGISAFVAVLSFLTSLAILFIGRHVAHKIMTNDLVHLGRDVKKAITKLDDLTKEVGDIKIIVEKREAVCEERHKD